MSSATANLTTLEKRLNYSKTFGTHVDLDFGKLMTDIHNVLTMATNISINATDEKSKKEVGYLIEQVTENDSGC